MFAMNRLVKNSVGISKRINVPIKSFSTVLDEIINITFIDREVNIIYMSWYRL